ncbi:MAG: methyltransferase regulatory domain-containing protein, partial [Phycisphaerae bacterium]
RDAFAPASGRRTYACFGSSSTSYDALPYDDRCFVATHPDRLATVATMHGLTPPAIESCRVLDLGCGVGMNIIGMACTLPGARFLGVDLSARQIEMGRSVAAELGLKNIEFSQGDIAKFDGGAGAFDYIISHGVYSWVPAEVQANILRICRRCLSPDGVAEVSYNTYPGWRGQGVVRDIMRHGARTRHGDQGGGAPAEPGAPAEHAEPAEQVRRAIALLGFVAANAAETDGPYAQALRREADDLARQRPTYLFHEYLEEVNSPLYFEEFVRRAADEGLAYIAESWAVDGSERLTADGRAALDALGLEPIARQQCLDFLINRRFRQSLLCHAGRPVQARPQARAMRGLYLAAMLSPVAGQGQEQARAGEQYMTAAGTKVTTNMPALKAAIAILNEAYPAAVPYWELWKMIRQGLGGVGVPPARGTGILPVDNGAETAPRRTGGTFMPPGKEAAGAGDDADLDALAAPLLACFQGAVVVPHAYCPPMARRASERPVAYALARWQAARSPEVVNLWHKTIEIDDVSRAVLAMLDGTRTAGDVAGEMLRLSREGKLQLAPPDKQVTAEGVERALGGLLGQLAVQALLVR